MASPAGSSASSPTAPARSFVYVDMDDDGNGDLSRSRKDSFYYMQKVYKSNGEDLD